MEDRALLGVFVCTVLLVDLWHVRGGCIELTPREGVEKEKVVGGAGVVELQVYTLLAMVPFTEQRAEMHPPVPSVV